MTAPPKCQSLDHPSPPTHPIHLQSTHLIHLPPPSRLALFAQVSQKLRPFFETDDSLLRNPVFWTEQVIVLFGSSPVEGTYRAIAANPTFYYRLLKLCIRVLHSRGINQGKDIARQLEGVLDLFANQKAAMEFFAKLRPPPSTALPPEAGSPPPPESSIFDVVLERSEVLSPSLPLIVPWPSIRVRPHGNPPPRQPGRVPRCPRIGREQRTHPRHHPPPPSPPPRSPNLRRASASSSSATLISTYSRRSRRAAAASRSACCSSRTTSLAAARAPP